MRFHPRRAAGLPLLCPLLLPGQQHHRPPPPKVVLNCLAANPAGGDSDRRMLRQSTAVRWSGQRTSSPPPHHPPTRSIIPLGHRRSSCHQQGQRGQWRWSTPHHCRLSGGSQLLPSFSLCLRGQYDVAPLPANELSLSSLSPTSCHRCHCVCQRALVWHHGVPSPQGRANVITTRWGT
jgi:hypothetical protein